MTRVLIADDSADSRALLSKVLGRDHSITIVGEARTGAEAVAMALRLRPDVVVMDVKMPVMNGYEATREIMVQAPTPVVILSVCVDDELQPGTEAFRVGAVATLEKFIDVDEPESEARAALLLRLVQDCA